MDAIAVRPRVVHCPLDENIGRVYRLLLGSLRPLRIVSPLKLTRQLLSSKMTLQPALHMMRMPSNDAIFILGTMCPINGWGKPGIKISHMCVDVILFPSSRLMVIGFVATQMLCIGAPAITKTDVAPVSASTCVGSMHIVFARCGVAVAQLDVTTVMSSLLIACYNNMYTCLVVGYNEYVSTLFLELTFVFTTRHHQKLLGYIVLCMPFLQNG